jgi:hypothetical protein
MSDVLSPRVLPPGAERVPVNVPGLPPALGVGVLVAVAALGVGLAFLQSSPGARALFAAFSLWAVVSAVVLGPWTRAVSPGRIRVDTAAPGLRFVAPAVLPAGMLALALIALATGILALALEIAGVPGVSSVGVGRVGPFALGAVGLGWLAVQLWALRTPAGLTLDPDGMRGVRSSHRIDIAWDDLESVSVVGGRAAKLVVTPRDGSPVLLDAHWSGSDPNLVAPIVEHFRTRAADRPALTDGRAAIRLVEEAVSRRA